MTLEARSGGSKGFKVRLAREEDIPAVMEINLASLPENYWYGFYKYLLEAYGKAFFVAEVDDRVVGYAMSRIEKTRDPVLLGLYSELDKKEEKPVLARILEAVKRQLGEERVVGHLVSIAVLREYRGMGIGSALLRETLKAVKEEYGAEAIYLEVRVSNYTAIRLYEKHGFRKVRLIRSYYRDGEDAYVMVKRFSDKETS